MGTITYTSFNGQVVSMNNNGVVHDLLPDPQGNTVALLDSNQNITDTFTYWPYGEERVRTGTTSCPFRYGGAHGYYHDPSTNKIYARAAYLAPAIGRWLTRANDRGSLPGVNPYAYASNRPATQVGHVLPAVGPPSPLAFDLGGTGVAAAESLDQCLDRCKRKLKQELAACRAAYNACVVGTHPPHSEEDCIRQRVHCDLRAAQHYADCVRDCARRCKPRKGRK